MNKKRALISIIVSSAILIILLTNLVSAQDFYKDFTSIIDNIVKSIEPVAKYNLGSTPSGELLFAKVLFFLIILAIVWTVLERIEFFSEYSWVLVVVSASASILATRWLSDVLVQTILLPYSTFGIAIAAGIPFILYFLLVHEGFKHQPAIIRKIAWVFFAVIFIGLWIMRRGDVKNGVWIYIGTAALALIFALMDGTIHRFFVRMELERAGKRSVLGAVQVLEGKLAELPNLIASGIINRQESARREKDYKSRIAYLKK